MYAYYLIKREMLSSWQHSQKCVSPFAATWIARFLFVVFVQFFFCLICPCVCNHTEQSSEISIKWVVFHIHTPLSPTETPTCRTEVHVKYMSTSGGEVSSRYKSVRVLIQAADQTLHLLCRNRGEADVPSTLMI